MPSKRVAGLYWRASLIFYTLIVATALSLALFVYNMLGDASPLEPLTVLVGIFVGSAFFDVVLGQNRSNVPSTCQAVVANALVARLLPLLVVAIASTSVVVACLALAPAWQTSWIKFLGSAAVVGVLNAAIGIVAAHELVHRPRVLDQAAGALMLTLSCYGSFLREHVHGHHRDVATNRDPSTARLNESIYAFLPRAIRGTLCKAWEVERRLAEAADRPLVSVANVTLWLWLFSAAAALALAAAGTLMTGVFFLAQSLVAIVTLETINYVQHYGLRRRVDEHGNPERVGARHAFNGPYWFSNLGFLNLLRHSDHHMFERRPFPILALRDDAPLLPLPAFLMMVVAYLPPIWRLLMNPRAIEANERS